MIVVMKPDATTAQIEHMAQHITALGLTPQVIHGKHQTVIAALGEERAGLTEVLEPGEGVEKVLPIMAPYKRASSELKRERTVVKARSLEVGGTQSGGHRRSLLGGERRADRGPGQEAQGSWGDRASRRCVQAADQPLQLPGAQGAGPEDAGRRRGRETGLAIVTEVMAPEHVPMVSEYADVLQIGARNMQNYQLAPGRGRLRQARPAEARHERDRSRNSCWPPSTSSTGAIPTSCSASGASAPSRTTPGSPCRWPRCPTSTTRATCRSSSTPRTAPGKSKLVIPMSPGRRRRRRRWPDHRGPRRPRARRQRRRPVDHPGRLRPAHGAVPADRRGRGSHALIPHGSQTMSNS